MGKKLDRRLGWDQNKQHNFKVLGYRSANPVHLSPNSLSNSLEGEGIHVTNRAARRGRAAMASKPTAAPKVRK